VIGKLIAARYLPLCRKGAEWWILLKKIWWLDNISLELCEEPEGLTARQSFAGRAGAPAAQAQTYPSNSKNEHHHKVEDH
jgi:hypothetical protein